ncbi:unnamed protein product [Darwinula stevensoni]|uniref:Vinculin n=1 Tax=Darwinula stevensoni TaxID=69355 RepID=A0A7R9ABG7_9CRUS|nr:unnamed protein product [Darwinula stevensoni]CAG0899150.1 unnamed protein product [Darwinula stevensoni]
MISVDRLVILHEEAEDGNAMPDLSRPVQAVSNAVANLIKVGRDTINSSDDPILRQDMPGSLHRVEGASRLLEDACAMLKADPYSQPARYVRDLFVPHHQTSFSLPIFGNRKKLIDGARGILQGTSALLLCFDESEVRKIIRECKKVLDYLAVAEVIETMEDLVQFVKDLSPCLTKVSREVDSRQKELTHQVHRDILIRCLDQVKTLAPILICSMKIFIQIIAQGGKGAEEAAENRNYLAGRMTDEITEIIRVLQLTTYDEDEWEADNLMAMKRSQNIIENKLQTAHDWLQDPLALRGGVGEKSLRQILTHAARVADRSLPPDRDAIHKMCGDISSMTDALCELRQTGQGRSPQAQSLADSIGQKLKELDALIARAIVNVEKSGMTQPAHTVAGRLEQAKRWLANPTVDDGGLGLRAVNLIVQEGRKVAEGLSGQERNEILSLCNEVDSLARELNDLVRRGLGNSPQAQQIARQLGYKLHQLKNSIQGALVDRVVEDFVDITTPLKQFTEAVMAPEGTPGREANFAEKANNLQAFSDRCAKTARLVASGSGGNKKLAEALLASASQVESLTPQLVNAGRIRMAYPENKAADEHFENLRQQYDASLHKMRALADEATDSAKFIKASEDAMRWHTEQCETAMGRREPQKMVDHTTAEARLANRVYMVAKQEADNSEDPVYNARVNRAAEGVQAAVSPMVRDAKTVTMNISDPKAQSHWRDSNNALLDSVANVREAVGVRSDDDFFPPPPDMSSLSLNANALHPISQPTLPYPGPPLLQNPEAELDDILRSMGTSSHGSLLHKDTAPPRPPLPGGDIPPPRPPPPETDDEDESPFTRPPLPNQPIMMAAHGLHQEVKQWSSRDNEIIAAAKRMAALMAKLSQLVRGEGGTKRDLIACAKAIADASQEVTRLAKELAKECTDKRMRTVRFCFFRLLVCFSAFLAHLGLLVQNLLQVCERIPTIGTQLKILSTVKATMLGAQGELLCLHAVSFISALSLWVLGFHGGIQFSRDLLLSESYGKFKSTRKEDIPERGRHGCAFSASLPLCLRVEVRGGGDQMIDVLYRVCVMLSMEREERVCHAFSASVFSAPTESFPRRDDGEITGGTEEDQEATDMLVGNAQNLMQSVKETVRAAEAASIKMRTDAGIRLRWVRRQPWYQY